MTTTVPFYYTGGPQTFIVPAGVTSLNVVMIGGVGGTQGTTGAPPGYINTTLAVTPGDKLFIHVGQCYPQNGQGGYPGGGWSNQSGAVPGNGGGGYTDIRKNTNNLAGQVLVAGGSGGRGWNNGSNNGGGGGHGGPDVGGAGGTASGNPNTPGAGGTQTDGGAGGSSGSGTAGSRAFGGNFTGTGVFPGGAGGGGYYGGGAGSGGGGTTTAADGGGGGSSFIFGALPSQPMGSILPTGNIPPYTTNGSGAYVTLTFDVAPSAPTPTSPPLNTYVDATVAQALAWTFSDPDTADYEQKADVRFRIVGASTWTTITTASGSTSGSPSTGTYTVAANTLANGNQYEWQVRSYDQLLTVGDWSPSSFFYTEVTPSVSLTSQTSTGTISAIPVTMNWSTTTQQSYQVQVIDSATSAVLTDTGEIAAAALRTLQMKPPNGSVVKFRIRVSTHYNSGFWSPWATSATQTITLPAPATPTLTAVGNSATGLITLAWTNPGSGDTPAGVSLWRTDTTAGGNVEQIGGALILPANTGFTDYFPASGHVYSYFVVVTGVSGGTSQSAAQTASVTLTRAWLTDVAVPSFSLVMGTSGSVGGGGSRSTQRAAGGGVRQYAGNRSRMALTADDTTTIGLAFNAITYAQYLALDRRFDASPAGLRGKTVCFRDTYGRRLFCAYSSVEPFAFPFTSPQLYSVGVTLQQVTPETLFTQQGGSL